MKLPKRLRTLVITLLSFILLAAVVLIGGALYMLDYSLNPKYQSHRDAASLHALQEYPGVVEWIDSMQQSGGLRDTFIVNPQGLRLHALYAQHPQALGTAVIAHGYTDNANRMLMIGEMFYDSLRFNILLPDHVRHGKSEGKMIQMGWLDRLNFERWVTIADSLWPSMPIYLHGISMGGATVMMTSADPLPSSVRGIIEDCGYTSVWDEFSGEIQNQFHLSPHPIMDVASMLCKILYGWSFTEASAIEQVRQSTLPILFIHGSDDHYVPTHMVHQLYAAKTQGFKQLWLAPSSAHARSYKDHPQEYLHQVRTFISATCQTCN